MAYTCEFRVASNYNPFAVQTPSSVAQCVENCCDVSSCLGFHFDGTVCRVYDHADAFGSGKVVDPNTDVSWLCVMLPPPPGAPP